MAKKQTKQVAKQEAAIQFCGQDSVKICVVEDRGDGNTTTVNVELHNSDSGTRDLVSDAKRVLTSLNR